MSIVVTVMNMKGGVGKTTVSLNLGGVLAWYKIANEYKKVLLIDYDPQFNLSQGMLSSNQYFQLEKEGKTSLRILQDDRNHVDPYSIQIPDSSSPPDPSTIVKSVLPQRSNRTLHIIPSTLDLMYIALGSATGDIDTIEKRWGTFIEKCRKIYDIIVIDCHPAGSILTKTALASSDHVLIPVIPQELAVRGVALMRRFVDASTASPDKPNLHILFNMLPRNGPTPQVVKSIRNDRRIGDLCLSNTLKKYSAFAEPNAGKGFVWLSQKPYSTQAFANLMVVRREFLTRMDAGQGAKK